MIRVLVSAVLWPLAFIYFVAYLALALALSYVFPFKTIDPFLKSLNRGLFRILFIRVRVLGLEGLDPAATYIYVANHSSMLDIPLVAGFVPGFLRGIEASRQHRWPLYGWAMGRLGNLPIERDDVHASISTMRKAAAYLESTGSLIVFPEGHRTTTGRLQPFKKLPFHLAKRAGKPLVPLAIRGMFEVNNKNSWMVRPGTVTMEFGEAIRPKEIADLKTVELRDLVAERMGGMMGTPGTSPDA